MIRLIGVLTHGGVPVTVKSSMDAEGERSSKGTK